MKVEAKQKTLDENAKKMEDQNNTIFTLTKVVG